MTGLQATKACQMNFGLVVLAELVYGRWDWWGIDETVSRELEKAEVKAVEFGEDLGCLQGADVSDSVAKFLEKISIAGDISISREAL